MPRRKKTPRQELIEQLDKTVSLLVRQRDKACITCGSMEKLGCGHLFSRQAYSTRWDLQNCNAQCWGCNYKHEYDFYPYEHCFKRKYGDEAHHELYRKFHRTIKFSDKDLKELLNRLNLELNDICPI